LPHFKFHIIRIVCFFIEEHSQNASLNGNSSLSHQFCGSFNNVGCTMAQLVKALHYKVAGLIPTGVSGISHWLNPFGRSMALGSTKPLTETSTRDISWGGGGGGL
jgi:hypothetical protein